jgi:hypothetical protein
MERITILFAVIITYIAALSFPQTVDAKTAATSAALATPIALQQVDDKRAQILQGYLESNNSPLAPFAKEIVQEADKNGLDYRLIPAIAGLESTFGIHIPAYSYNAWGFGIYGDNVRRFASWEEGIAVVSKAIREDYINKNKAQSVYDIGKMYAASPTWAVRVEYFMAKMEAYQTNQVNKLALSL